MAQRQPLLEDQEAQGAGEAWRDRVRQVPGAVVHRPQKRVRFVPSLRVIGPIDVDESLDWREDDSQVNGDRAGS